MDADARSFCSQLDFKGFMLSDWAALVSGIPPALAGGDMNMPGFIAYGNGPQDEENPAVSRLSPSLSSHLYSLASLDRRSLTTLSGELHSLTLSAMGVYLSGGWMIW